MANLVLVIFVIVSLVALVVGSIALGYAVDNRNDSDSDDKTSTQGITHDYDAIASGHIVAWVGQDIPGGYLQCDGSVLKKNEYAKLFGVIGYKFGGAGNTFRVPDLRGRHLIGQGTGTDLSTRVFASSGGSETHTLLEAEMAAHSHPLGVSTQGPDTAAIADAVLCDRGVTLAYNEEEPDELMATSTQSIVGSGTPFDIMTPFTVVHFIIKY